MDSKSERLVRLLCKKNRVVLLGGMAMLAHGFARFTRDIDIWLDPSKGIDSWSKTLTAAVSCFKKTTFISVRTKKEVLASQVQSLVKKEEMIRLTGLDMDVDVFFRPNNLRTEDFDSVWSRSSEKEKGLNIPDEIDLGLTKMGTERIQDRIDIEWLDAKIIPILSKKLESCSLDEAGIVFSRITSIPLLKSAMKNSNPHVRSLAAMLQKKLKH
ncbi:MAG: hypothetical protein WAX69_13380 [Victivallales bacterium]